MPPKIRDLIADLEKAGFVNRGGKGSHRNYVHPMVIKPVTVSGISVMMPNNTSSRQFDWHYRRQRNEG